MASLLFFSECKHGKKLQIPVNDKNTLKQTSQIIAPTERPLLNSTESHGRNMTVV
jgi:hypothetical protein